jgi:tetratricopeptide (TPR) repeat protein
VKGEIMSASPLDIPADAGSRQEKALSWKATALLATIVFGGSLCFSFLGQEIIFDNGPSRSAIVRSADPDYRIQLLEKAVFRYPGNAAAWLQLGHAYSEFGQAALAAAAYENYLAINPNSPDTWTKLGVQYAQTDGPDKALEAFNQAIALNPKHEASRLYKGVVLLNAFSDLRGAIRSWMQVLEANPEAAASDGTPIEERIAYCLAASEVKTAGAEKNAE